MVGMDMLTVIAFVALFTCSQAIKCHDCTSWNPYCRETVNEPFSDAVATVECEKTQTCFIKKESSGAISRGCTDWWMETQIEIDYDGCRIQEVQWLGSQTWCFCKTDHCNGASIEMLSSGVVSGPSDAEKAEKSNRIQDDGWVGWNFNNDLPEVPDSHQVKNWNDIVTVPWSEWEHDGTGLKTTTPSPSEDSPEPQHLFDDTNPIYNLEELDHSQDPAWQLWWWHADSDRPQFNDFERTWKAPSWVESQNGHGWDFPVSTRKQQLQQQQQVQRRLTTTTEESWNWGNGWGHIFPWWSGRGASSTPTLVTTETPRTRRWTTRFIPTINPIIIQNEPDNTLHEVVEKAQENNDVDITNDISTAEFFCWDCYSDSSLCAERVNTIKAHHVGKTSCPSTNKCFVRQQGDVIYRGCADGWMNSVISQDYVGCRTQMLWGKPVEWCFCEASLCNGDSITDIRDKYINPDPQLFIGNVTTLAPSAKNTTSEVTWNETTGYETVTHTLTTAKHYVNEYNSGSIFTSRDDISESTTPEASSTTDISTSDSTNSFKTTTKRISKRKNDKNSTKFMSLLSKNRQLHVS